MRRLREPPPTEWRSPGAERRRVPRSRRIGAGLAPPAPGLREAGLRAGAGRGARNQGFLGPSAAPPSGGECGCARRVPVSGERRAGRGPRERASEPASRAAAPAAAASRRRPLRASPPRPHQPCLAAPGPATPASPVRPPRTPRLGRHSQQPAPSRAQRHRSQCPPAPQTEPSPENPFPAPRSSATVPELSLQHRRRSRVGAQPSGEPQVQPERTERSAPQQQHGAATLVPLPRGPAISSERRGEGARRAGGRARRRGGAGSQARRGRGPESALRSRATQGGRQRASISPAPRARCGDHLTAEREFPDSLSSPPLPLPGAGL